VPLTLIQDMFDDDPRRNIEEVIKVDQTDEKIIREEIKEYIATKTICGFYTAILDRYLETPNKPHDGIGIWVAGFFGSGKSSFAKLLGLAIEDRELGDDHAAELFGKRTGDSKIQVLLKNITARIPTEAVIFDVSTERGVRTGNQTLTEITYRMFLKRLGYSETLELAELEITLEERDQLKTFEATFENIYKREWDKEKGKVAIALNQASRVMHELDPATFPSADSWVQAVKAKADVSPGLLAERCKELMARRRPGKSLIFVIDEVGQFVARDVQKMLDLQGIVQSLGRVGRGKIWLVVTSQEKLTEIVSGLDDKRTELARLQDRFPRELQVHLEPSDISEVTGKRVLSKNADAQKLLRKLFQDHRGRLTDNTKITADIVLPALTADAFIDLYPVLPYQVDFIIQVVSGLRTQSSASRHVGGANRTIIKLAQQLIINPAVDLASQPIGKLVRADHVYDLTAGNIDSELRNKIAEIPQHVAHPLAGPVAKAICLLQFVKSIHSNASNIAAILHPAVDADSQLSAVNEALAALEKAHKVRRGDEGYRIPSPIEDDWETQRDKRQPKQGDINRILAKVVEELWDPQPSHNFLETRQFKAGLFLNGKEVKEGDLAVHLTLAEEKEYGGQAQQARARSQSEDKSIFWVAPLNDTVDREILEVFRSEEILSVRERNAQGKEETKLVAEEKRRMKRHMDELKRLVKTTCLAGAAYFQGNDRSPGQHAVDVGKTASDLLALALPQVFSRFDEAAARVKKQDLDVLLTSENLHGLTPVFDHLKLLRPERGKPVFDTDSGPLREVLGRIVTQYEYGNAPHGRWLADEFAKEPFGWDFEAVRLFVLSLLRAGKIDVTSKGETIDSALSGEAKNVFGNNNLFRQASFRPRITVGFDKLVEANTAFQSAFGKDIPELEPGVVTRTIREEVARQEEAVRDVHTTLLTHRLPGAEVLADALEQMRGLGRGAEANTIVSFIGSHAEIKEAVKRANQLSQELTEPKLQDLARARTAQERLWPFLKDEVDLSQGVRDHAQKLDDLLKQETFFKKLADIDQDARALETAYHQRFAAAVTDRSAAYNQALTELKATPGWCEAAPDQQERIAAPLVARCGTQVDKATPIPQLRADTEACRSRLHKAVEELARLLAGNRHASLNVASFFAGGIETEEQLDAALAGLRAKCLELLGMNKKILVQ
jgi:Family of unknown function (DUF6079)